MRPKPAAKVVDGCATAQAPCCRLTCAGQVDEFVWSVRMRFSGQYSAILQKAALLNNAAYSRY